MLAVDHLIENTEEFRRCLDIAIEAAEERKLVTFGVVPNKPETGYGYNKTAANNSPPVKPVLQFVENPTVNWRKNIWLRVVITGIVGCLFPWRHHLLTSWKDCSQSWFDIYKSFFGECSKDLDFLRLGAANFEKCSNISIDYALMEHTSNAWTVPLLAVGAILVAGTQYGMLLRRMILVTAAKGCNFTGLP